MQNCDAPFTWWGTIQYSDALARMESAQADAIAARSQQEISERADSFFYLEHPAVITYGRATPEDELALGAPEIPRVAVPRGGLATYHAPGQLVGYIVMDLSRRQGAAPDIHAYLRALEQALINFAAAEFSLETTRREGFTGLWTVPEEASPGRKLASIGVSARKWVTSHGFALNIHPDMTGFDAIVPCGITDARMSSIEQELLRSGRVFTPKPMADYAEAMHRHVISALQSEGWLL